MSSARGRRAPRICPLFVVVSLSCYALSANTDESLPPVGAGNSESGIDPAAWGGDHVGKPVPEYITGDECLFCHRDIGSTWHDNRHQLTIRRAVLAPTSIQLLRDSPKTKQVADQVEFVLGARRQVRFLKRSSEYGMFDLLSTALAPSGDANRRLINTDNPRWDSTAFARKCAGCHTTGVDPSSMAFSSISLDCFTCHGDVELEHTKNTSRVLLSNTNRQPRQVVSICGQCHLRGGKSRSTRLPYPNNFVSGDNLFRDFDVDLSDAHLNQLNPADKHIFENVRDVAISGKTQLTCLTCHDIHAQSTEKHQELIETALCNSCHVPGESKTDYQSHLAHSAVCGY